MAAESVEATGSVLVFGSLNIDLVTRVDHIARPGETVLGPTYEQLFGGKGANQAVAAARIADDGITVRMVGAVGEDELGAAVTHNLEAYGIDASGVVRREEPTGAAFISIDRDGENAITVASGANRTLSIDALQNVPVDEATVLLLQMETPVEASIEMARRVKSVGGRTVLNLAPAPGDLTERVLRALTEPLDWLIVNELELETAAKALGLKDRTMGDLATKLGAALKIGVVATLGPDGVVAVPLGGDAFVEPAPSIEVVDTTGAGDTFCGVFAGALAERLVIRTAVRRAVTAASLACRKIGAQTAMPTRDDLAATLDADRL